MCIPKLFSTINYLFENLGYLQMSEKNNNNCDQVTNYNKKKELVCTPGSEFVEANTLAKWKKAGAKCLLMPRF